MHVWIYLSIHASIYPSIFFYMGRRYLSYLLPGERGHSYLSTYPIYTYNPKLPIHM